MYFGESDSRAHIFLSNTVALLPALAGLSLSGEHDRPYSLLSEFDEYLPSSSGCQVCRCTRSDPRLNVVH